MADPMFGWAALEVIKVIRACNHFAIAYRNGPDGARAHFTHIQEQTENCKVILESIKEELETQDKRIYIGFKSLTNTLNECTHIFVSSNIYFKPASESTVVRKAVGAVQYMWSGQEDLNRISRTLESQIKYIGVWLQLIQRKSSKIQLGHLEKIGQTLDQHDSKLAEILSQLELLRQGPLQTQTANYHSRSYSAVEFRPSKPINVILQPELYEEDLQSYIDVTKLLVTVSKAEAESKSAEEREIVSQIKAESIDARNRIEASIARNQSKGAQIARAEIPQSSSSSRQRTESEDSGYATSVRSLDVYERYWSSPAPSTQEPTNRAPGISEQAWNLPIFPISDSRSPSQQDSDAYSILTISQASIAFNAPSQLRYSSKCTVKATYRNDYLTDIHIEKHLVPRHINNIEIPTLRFNPETPRPIPHVELRFQTEPRRHPVMIISTIPGQIVPQVHGLEYVFDCFQDSKRFQKLIFGKEMILFLEVSKIRSNRGKEGDNIILRLWENTDASTRDKSRFSILYHANGRNSNEQEHVEIFLNDIGTLAVRKDRSNKIKGLKMNLIQYTKSWTKFGFLDIVFSPETIDEDPIDRGKLTTLLDPTNN